MTGSVTNRQTKFKIKYSTGPISTSNTEVDADCPLLSICSIAGIADFTVWKNCSIPLTVK